jgi:hypothetical protein
MDTDWRRIVTAENVKMGTNPAGEEAWRQDHCGAEKSQEGGATLVSAGTEAEGSSHGKSGLEDDRRFPPEWRQLYDGRRIGRRSAQGCGWSREARQWRWRSLVYRVEGQHAQVFDWS